MAPGPPLSSRDDVTPFLKITAELGLNPDTTLVSCPNTDGAYGGAMGPAQFIPTTWMAYKDKVAAITGNSPASPWRNIDAFVAAGLYLKGAGAGSSELNAAARYYCGSNWNRYVCTQVYGKAVVDRAVQFEQDIQVLKSG
ncbi:MAG: lytic murein transglycosylase [Candidatus Colwellbacteria bacterium]|nr:lytic murein transglycosylase [Candidatus Colwellbacteria bacterium]